MKKSKADPRIAKLERKVAELAKRIATPELMSEGKPPLPVITITESGRHLGRVYVGYTATTMKLLDEVCLRYPAIKRATVAAHALHLGLEKIARQPVND